MMHRILILAACAAMLALAPQGKAHAFCGFYVAKADTKLFNNASKVVLTRNQGRSVITMASDYHGDARDFAMVIPVPEVLKREQINTASMELVNRVDAFSAPRLVEYHDPDPCRDYEVFDLSLDEATQMSQEDPIRTLTQTQRSLGVTVEAEYEVDEYDVKILSAKQSDGLIIWLNQEGYKIPDGAEPVIGSYLKQDMKFFIAKVNMDRFKHTDGKYLPPLQVAYESDKFMLPVRLGTVNSIDNQELFVFALTRGGRIETSNYRTKKLPTGMDIPIFVKSDFGNFYKAMFGKLVGEDDYRNVYLEYAWNLSVKCDPCVAGQLMPSELVQLGAWWVADDLAAAREMDQRGFWQGDSFITRLHLRYNAKNFPEDLKFIETGNKENWQARYVLRHPAKVTANQCDKAGPYLQSLLPRFDKEAENLAQLTGWPKTDIRSKMAANGQPASFTGIAPAGDAPWYKRMWNADE